MKIVTLIIRVFWSLDMVAHTQSQHLGGKGMRVKILNPDLHSKFKDSLNYMKVSLKKKKNLASEKSELLQVTALIFKCEVLFLIEVGVDFCIP